MTTFHVLGALDLRGPEGRHLGSPLSGSKRLALLAYLTLAGRRGLHSRDTLLGMFWPESEQKRARNSLSNMLHQIRRSLGADALVACGHDQVGLSEGALRCDALVFEEAVDERRFADAMELYRGDLLQGLFVSDASPEFDHWLDAERARLRGRAGEAARALTEAAERAGDAAEALRWARRVVAFDPYDELAARRLIVLLDRLGDRAGALRAYDELAARLAREFEAEPAAETRAVIEGVRDRNEPGEAAAHPNGVPGRSGSGRPGGRWSADDAGPEPFSIRSVAVLPFENLSGTPDAEPFAAGLHDDLLTELSRFSAMSVIARTSVLRYRGASKPIPEIAHELGVGTIIEGGVQISGGRLRLNVQVIDAATGVHRWAERYDRELSAQSIFDLQGELSREIAEALQAELTAGEMGRPAGGERTQDLEAYRLCVQGRTLLDQRTPLAMYRSVDYFRRAIERDSRYALAWSGLADAMSLLEFYDHSPPPSAPGPMHAALRAVELGPNLGQAHASLGIIRSIRQEGPPALIELERAIELAPSYAEAHAWLGWVQLLRGRPVEALAAERRAVELDPLAPAFRAYLAEIFLVNGQPHEALREATNAREIQPEYGLTHFVEGLALYHLQRLPEAAAAVETALRLVSPRGSPSHAEVHAVLGLIRIAAGDQEAGRAGLARIDEAAHPFSRGIVLAALGDLDGAFSEFERVRTWDSFSGEIFRYFFPDLLRPFRADPRYDRIRRVIDRAWACERDAPPSPGDALA